MAKPILKITSPKNPRLRTAEMLRERKYRDKHGRFLVEGAREISRAVASNFTIHEIFYCPETMSPEARAIIERASRLSDMSLYELDQNCFQKIAVRETTDGLIAIFSLPSRSISTLRLSENPLIVAVEGLEKPGNLGAIVRSCDAVGADGIILIDSAADPFSPNAIRSSVGTVFSVPIATASLEEFAEFCQIRGLLCFAAALGRDAQDYTMVNYSKPTALFFGSESSGLSPEAKACCSSTVMIPMAGIADSLNVSVAAAVMLFEVRRQRCAVDSK